MLMGPSRNKSSPKRTWIELARIDPKKCNLYEDLVSDRLEWRSKIHVADPNIVGTRL